MANMTLLEWMKSVTDPIIRNVIRTLFTEENFFQYIPFRTVNGLSLPYTTEVSLPGVAFRKLNAPFTPTVGVVQRNNEVLKPFGGDSLTDKVFVDTYGNGERTTRDRGFVTNMAVKYVQTFMYGNSPGSRAGTAYDDVDGFDGIQARVTSAQTVNAGGAAGSDSSSVFVIRFGDGLCQGLQTPIGMDARDLGEQGSSEGPMLLTRVDHTAGMAIYNGASVSWIKNIRDTSAKLTADMMDEAVDKITGTPTIILMSKRSRRQLKIDAKGTGSLSMSLDQLSRPITAWDGVPIITSDAMTDAETAA